MLKAKIYIIPKETVADPQGLTVKHALNSMGYKETEDVRMGKLIMVKLNIQDREKAEKVLEQMCKKLLANPIIENYSFEIEEV